MRPAFVLPEVPNDLASLNKEVGRQAMAIAQLRRALQDYGQHRDYCHFEAGSPCRCGLDDLRRVK